MDKEIIEQAQNFINNEKQFHLGFLPTEQSSLLTKNLDLEFQKSTVDGVKNLQVVDRNVLEMAKKVFKSSEFKKLVNDGIETVKNNGRIIFSGCGATGRLSIVLDCMWRNGCAKNDKLNKYEDNIASIMTGGDYALVKSVEFFEDYQQFGRRQAQELNINDNDMLVAITEGGETSSVLGTVFEAVERGSKVFLLFNNPADLLADNLERSRQAIRNPKVTVLDLFCGAMALAGSTRMQATTAEQLIASGAIEAILNDLSDVPNVDFANEFGKLLDALENGVESIAKYIDFEAEVYQNKGKVTYFANHCLLDIFTDTTERSPTFMLPPFRKCDDKISPDSWAFVKNPLYSTKEVWQKNMRRALRCLEWSKKDYIAMNSPQGLIDNPPEINENGFMKFTIGNENFDERCQNKYDSAILVRVGNEKDNELIESYQKFNQNTPICKTLSVSNDNEGDFIVKYKAPVTVLNMFEHLAIKLVLNTISTGTMVVMGRVSGNWMSFVNVSNKKLMDRGIRLISEIGKLDYETAAIELFAAFDYIVKNTPANEEPESAVQYVLRNLK